MTRKPFKMWAFFFSDSGQQGQHGQLAKKMDRTKWKSHTRSLLFTNSN